MNTDFARQQMVQQQVRAWDVLDKEILDVLAAIPREQFVPAGLEPLAFADTEIPIGHGQYMMTPTLEGRLLQALDLTAADDVLEVGTGSGFLTACLARLSGSVLSIDIYDGFLDAAEGNLADSGLTNVELGAMNAVHDLPQQEFDAIAVTGSLQSFDPRFVAALKPGGRLFVIVGEAPIMDARLVTRTGDKDWESTSLFETSVAPLVGGANPPGFSF